MVAHRQWGKKHSVAFILMSLLGSVLILNLLTSYKAGADSTIDSSAYESTSANNSGSRVVFTTDQIGYAFYQEIATGNITVVYSKTTDGGTSWGSPVTVDSQVDTLGVAVWYDRWTPGDTTGTYIHIVTKDDGSDDLWYTRLDTSNDSLTSPVSVTSSPAPNKTNSLISAQNDPIAITKGTTGVIYIGLNDNGASGGYVVKCSSTCTSGGNWTDSGAISLGNADDNWIGLAPLASGNVLIVEKVETVDDIQSKVYNGTSWDGSWTAINSSTLGNTSHDAGQMGLTVRRSSNDVYLTYANDTDVLGTNDDIKTAVYTSGSWTNKTDVITNDSKGVTNTKIAVDENNGDIYALYTAETTPGTITTANVYWKKSTDGMTSWGSEQGPINTGAEEINTMAVTLMSNERIYATWNKNNGASADSYHGHTVADITSNSTPAAPTHIFPEVSATGVRGYPTFRLRSSDADNDYLRYKIDVCSTSNCSAIVRTIDQTSSQTGWTGQDANGNTAYTGSSTLSSSTVAIHTYQVPGLTANTQYWWRAYAIDPAGTNTFSSPSSILDFTIGPAVNIEVRGGSVIRGGGAIR